MENEELITEQEQTAQEEETKATEPLTKERIDKILAAVGITLNSKNNAVSDGERISDTIANKLLKTQGITIEEIRTALQNLANKPVPIPDDLRFGDTFAESRICPPALAKHVRWNKADDRIFKYFSIARASDSGSFILLISNLETQYKCVQMSGSSTANLAEITEACSKITIKDDDGKVKTLYEHINDQYDEIMKTAAEKYKKLDLRKFGEWAAREGLPSMMVNNFNLIVNRESKEIELASGQKQTMYRVNAMLFGTDKGAKEFPLDGIAKHFESLAEVPSRIAKIPKIYSNDFSEPALYHIDLDKIAKPGPHPTWDKYLSRFREDEGGVIRAFIWSIFKADNTGRQMLYFYDPDGYSGKSVLTNAITQCLSENLVAALQKDSLNNQFSMAKIWNKRLVIIDDNKNPNLIRSEKIHIVLGNGLADVEAKGKNSFLYRMQTKIIASGNTKLIIDPSANHERTRVIVVEPHVTDEMLKEFAVCDKDGNVKRNQYGRVQLIGDTEFEKNLIKEFPAFLADCKKDYERLCPKNSSIIISEEMEDTLECLSDDIYDILDEILEDRFDFSDKDAKMTVRDFNDVLEDDVMYDISETFKKKGKGITTEDVVQHMAKRYGVSKKPCRVDGTPKKCYVGVKLKARQGTARPKDDKVVSLEKAKKATEAEIYGLFGKEAMADVD